MIVSSVVTACFRGNSVILSPFPASTGRRVALSESARRAAEILLQSDYVAVD